MTHRIHLTFLFLALLLTASCKGKGSLTTVATETKGKRLAVVSLAVNDYGGSLQGWNKQNTDDLLSKKMNEMLGIAEARFGQKWTVVPAAGFVASPGYQSQKGPAREVAVPKIDGQPMQLFGNDRKEMVKTTVAPAKVAALAKATGADLLAVLYLEWTVATGSFVPTSKPLTKTVVGVYDAGGNKLYHGRKDVMGERTLGAFGKTVVDENTINDWIGAFDKGLTALLSGG